MASVAQRNGGGPGHHLFRLFIFPTNSFHKCDTNAYLGPHPEQYWDRVVTKTKTCHQGAHRPVGETQSCHEAVTALGSQFWVVGSAGRVDRGGMGAARWWWGPAEGRQHPGGRDCMSKNPEGCRRICWAQKKKESVDRGNSLC